MTNSKKTKTKWGSKITNHKFGSSSGVSDNTDNNNDDNDDDNGNNSKHKKTTIMLVRAVFVMTFASSNHRMQ